MALIKTAKSPHMLKDAVVLDIGDLGRQAERMLSKAREEAQTILANARAEERRLIDGADKRGYDKGLSRGLNEGREQGRDEGRQQALAESAEQIAQLTRRWEQALSEWESQRTAMIQQAREDVLVFAFELARKIVHRVLQSDSTIVKDQVSAALALLVRPQAVAIHVHPDDRDAVQEVLPAILKAAAGCEHARLQEDSTIERGGCIVTTQRGRLDATISTQLDRIAEAILPSTASTETNGNASAPATP
jgi:flagellar assembly protein FliH